MTVLFAENGGGKTAVLTALAVGLTAFQSGTQRGLKLDPRRDPRQVTLDERGRREPAGPCTLIWTADVGAAQGVAWVSTVNPASNRKEVHHREVLDAMEQMRVPGARWPLFAFYGVDRMGRGKASTKPAPTKPDRWEGYAGSLNAAQDDSALLTWLLEEILADTVRRQEGQAERFLASAVMDTLVKATPGVERAWYDPRERSPVVRFETGEVATWQELSDGFHVYLALVADIARRAVMLNEQDGGEAPALVEGVVLIDEIDLHLHPRWQRVVLDGLRKVFPRLQFIVTTHSPQVLSSAKTARSAIWSAGSSKSTACSSRAGTATRSSASRWGPTIGTPRARRSSAHSMTPSTRGPGAGRGPVRGAPGQVGRPRPRADPRAGDDGLGGLMRGLRKPRPPKDVSPHGQPPRSLQQAERDFLAALRSATDKSGFARSTFNGLEKPKLRAVLYVEQGALCVYCECRVAEAPSAATHRPLAAPRTESRACASLAEPLPVLRESGDLRLPQGRGPAAGYPTKTPICPGRWITPTSIAWASPASGRCTSARTRR